MGSLLNFVWFSHKLEKNGDDNTTIAGPLFWNVDKSKYSHTFNGEIREGYKNLILMEGRHTLQSFSNLDTNLINYIKNNDVKLLAVSLADPSSYSNYIESITFLNKTIPNKFIIIDSNTALPEKYVIDYFLEEASSKHSKSTLFTHKNDLGYVSEDIEITELDNFRTKKFISFNRTTDKHHRARLLHEYLTNDYSDSYFSFLSPLEHLGDIDSVGSITHNRDFYNKEIPIELDTMDCENKSGFGTNATFKKHLFLNSCINLVTETSFDCNQLFISEKVLKPIICYQPFIVFGPYQYLKRLKTYGYKTFSDVWDESYDDIEDWRERLKVLIDLVNGLNSKSIEEINEIYLKTKNICIYNRELFNSLELDSFPQIFKNIENEW
jgi:hypothetical protein